MNAGKSSSATGTTGIADSPARGGHGYRGRFAPTPSGPLHFGSLIAAVGSYLDARAHGGEWLVRIEDLDAPRERPGAADQILRTLDQHDLNWDGEVLRQSSRHDVYAAALERLRALGLTRRCTCSRSALAALRENAGHEHGDELFHPADCIAGGNAATDGCSIRFRCPDDVVCFTDRAQGPQSENVSHTVGDFVLQRRDGLYAYQLAVVVDDAAQGITDVVRGADLLASTPRQLLLQRALGLPAPSYLHLPLAVDDRGRKLSKSEDAPAIGLASPAGRILAALQFLRQDPPAELWGVPLADVWLWARSHWRPERIRGVKARPVDAARWQVGVQEMAR